MKTNSNIWEADDPWFDGIFHLPLFDISVNPKIPLTQIKERRFDLIARAQEITLKESANSILTNDMWKADDPWGFTWKTTSFYNVINRNGDLWQSS
jgi:hypothetical protein